MVSRDAVCVPVSRVTDPAFVKAMSAFVRKAVAAEVSVDKVAVLKTVEVIASRSPPARIGSG